MAATGFHTVDELNDLLPGTLPGLLGIAFTAHEPGRIEGHLDVRREVLAPNGYLHAATVVGLADTACGLPPPPARRGRGPPARGAAPPGPPGRGGGGGPPSGNKGEPPGGGGGGGG